MTIRLAISITTKTGQGHRQVQAFERLAPLVRAEDGCLQYDLHAVEGEPDRFLLLELWQSQTQLDAHDLAPHMVQQDADNTDFRDGPVTVLILSSAPLA